MTVFDRSEIIWGQAGLPGTGLTAGEKTTINSRLTALEALVVPTSINDLTDVDLTGIATGDLLKWDGTKLVKYTLPGIVMTYAIPMSMVSASDTVPVATGVKWEAEIAIPALSTVIDYALVGTPITGQTTGSAVVDILRDSLANYPPGAGDSIVGAGAKPTISGNVKNVSSSLTSWNTSLPATHFVRPEVISCTNLQRLMLVLYVSRTLTI